MSDCLSFPPKWSKGIYLNPDRNLLFLQKTMATDSEKPEVDLYFYIKSPGIREKVLRGLGRNVHRHSGTKSHIRERGELGGGG